MKYQTNKIKPEVEKGAVNEATTQLDSEAEKMDVVRYGKIGIPVFDGETTKDMYYEKIAERELELRGQKVTPQTVALVAEIDRTMNEDEEPKTWYEVLDELNLIEELGKGDYVKGRYLLKTLRKKE